MLNSQIVVNHTSPRDPTFRKYATQILTLARPHRTRLAASLLLTGLGVLAGLWMPLGLKALLNSALHPTPTMWSLGALTAALFALLTTRAMLNVWGGYILRMTGERIVADLRKRVYAHLHTLSLRYFANARVGELTSRLTTDVGALRSAVTEGAVSSVLQVMKLVGSVAIMMSLNWRLGALVLITTPGVTLASRIFGDKLRQLSRLGQDKIAHATAVAQEALTAIRLVQVTGRAPHETARYDAAVEDVFTLLRQSSRTSIALGAIIELLFMAATISIFWYGGREVIAGRLSPGDMVAFLFYSQNIAGSISDMTSLYTSFNTAAGASERLFELLALQPELAEVAGAKTLSRVRGRIEFRHVSFAYEPERPVLRNVSFVVEPGQTVALVGRSGAGKSTISALIPRLYDPLAGQVKIDGADVRTLTLESLRENIAVVSQDTQLFHTSIRENIRYGRLNATDVEIERAASLANASGFIDALPDGYETIVGESGVKLSGGQRQRVAIARALLRDAPILLLDEATSSIDAESESLIREALDRLRKERTTLVIAHRLNTVRDADRILVLDGGEIIEAGTHAALMSRNGLYEALAALQLDAASSAA